MNDDTELDALTFGTYGNTKRSNMDALRQYVRGPTSWEDRYSLPSETSDKNVALDELFGVK